MMKALLIALILLSSATAGNIFYQDFTSPVFPPAGWSLSYYGSGGSWIWSESGQAGNGYAHGQVAIAPPGPNSATLISKSFSLTAGNSCGACFSFRSYITLGSPTCTWSYILRQGSTELESIDLGQTGSSTTWTDTCVQFGTTPTTASNYSVAWRVTVNGTGAASFDVDTIHVYENVEAVEAKSLGKIKSTFR